MKRFLILAVFAAVILAVCGCSKEYPVIPVYGKVSVSPSSPVPGQNFKVQIQVKEQGSGFYRGYYHVHIYKGGTEVIVPAVTVKVVDPTSYAPVVLEDARFALTEKGTYSISCSVELDTETPLPSGQVAASPMIESSTFTVN